MGEEDWDTLLGLEYLSSGVGEFPEWGIGDSKLMGGPNMAVELE